MSAQRDYFGETGINRQRLLWAIATRRQLERWELYVSKFGYELWHGRQLGGQETWLAAMEHHFTLIAARNMLRALELGPTRVVPDPTLRDELREGRDLNEHWDENMPIFNVTPRPAVPNYASGKNFAARNPKSGPYNWLSFSGKEGARLLPNVTALALHALVDEVEAEVLDNDEEMRRFVPPRAPSPWLYDEDKEAWWPNPHGHQKTVAR